VPEVIVEGELELPEGALVVDRADDIVVLRSAFDEGRPVVVRANTPEAVGRALARPEVSCVLVPAARRDLLELDLRALTYG
jgi:hypothetical protein